MALWRAAETLEASASTFILCRGCVEFIHLVLHRLPSGNNGSLSVCLRHLSHPTRRCTAKLTAPTLWGFVVGAIVTTPRVLTPVEIVSRRVLVSN